MRREECGSRNFKCVMGYLLEKIKNTFLLHKHFVVQARPFRRLCRGFQKLSHIV